MFYCIIFVLLYLGLHQKLAQILPFFCFMCSVFQALLKFFLNVIALSRHLFNEELRKRHGKNKMPLFISEKNPTVFIPTDALNSVLFLLFSAARTTASIFSLSSPFFCLVLWAQPACAALAALLPWSCKCDHQFICISFSMHTLWTAGFNPVDGMKRAAPWSPAEHRVKLQFHVLHNNCYQFSEWGCA